jgi:hypothetical protein
MILMAEQWSLNPPSTQKAHGPDEYFHHLPEEMT